MSNRENLPQEAIDALGAGMVSLPAGLVEQMRLAEERSEPVRAGIALIAISS